MQAAWSVAQRRLHWAMAGLVFVNFLLALVMVALPLSALFAKILTYQLHKSLGLLLIPLWAWRLWLLVRRGRPASVALPGWQHAPADTQGLHQPYAQDRACFMRYSSPCQCWVS